MVQMDMHRRNDRRVKFVLKLGQSLGESARMMIVHESNGPEYLGFRRLPHLLHEFIADHVPECLRPVRITALSNQLVELLQQVFVNCNTNSAKVWHRSSVIRLSAPRAPAPSKSPAVLGFRRSFPQHHLHAVPLREKPSKGSSYPESYLERFDGMENVRECRIACGRDSGRIGVVNVVIFAVQ
jgi:hypothetical protein